MDTLTESILGNTISGILTVAAIGAGALVWKWFTKPKRIEAALPVISITPIALTEENGKKPVANWKDEIFLWVVSWMYSTLTLISLVVWLAEIPQKSSPPWPNGFTLTLVSVGGSIFSFVLFGMTRLMTKPSHKWWSFALLVLTPLVFSILSVAIATAKMEGK